MGFLSPTGGNNWSSAQRDLLLSGTDISEANSFGNITNVDYAYLDITLRQGQTSEVKWNFAGTDYAPYNDGSFASFVPILGTTGGGTLNGSFDSFSPLASILGPGKRVGDYGKSGWETLEIGSTTGGDYRLGFATFNVNDTAVTPALFIDHIPDHNNAPFANSISYDLTEDSNVGGLLFNATDSDNDPLTYSFSQPGNGLVTLSQDGSTFSYQPNQNFNGIDSFTYLANDGLLSSNTATVSLNVASVNDNPEATDDITTVFENETTTISALANDTDVDQGTLLSIDSASSSKGITTTDGQVVTFSANSDFDYLGENQTATETISYTVKDGDGGWDSAFISASVIGVNDDVTITTISDGGKILDGAFSDQLPDSYSYSLNLYDIDQTDQISLSKYQASDVYGDLQLPSLGAGERSSEFKYVVDQDQPAISSNVQENYVIRADDGYSLSDKEFDIEIIGSGQSNNLTITSKGQGNIDDVDFDNLSSIDLRSGDDSATLRVGGEINFVDGGKGNNTLKINSPRANVDLVDAGAGDVDENTDFANFGTVVASSDVGDILNIESNSPVVDLNDSGSGVVTHKSTQFSNGDFGSGLAGWTPIKGNTPLDGNYQIGEFATPVDQTYSHPQGYNSSSFTARQDVSIQDGSLSLKTGNGNINSYGTIKGPAVISDDPVSLNQGDIVSFDWTAQSGGDAYDAYGYLLNVDTGSTINLLDRTGANYGVVDSDTESVTIGAGQDGDYKFVFVAGSFDATGGLYVGGGLSIDNIQTTIQSVDANFTTTFSEFDQINSTQGNGVLNINLDNPYASLTGNKAGYVNGTEISGFASLANNVANDGTLTTNDDAVLSGNQVGTTNGTEISGFASLANNVANDGTLTTNDDAVLSGNQVGTTNKTDFDGFKTIVASSEDQSFDIHFSEADVDLVSPGDGDVDEETNFSGFASVNASSAAGDVLNDQMGGSSLETKGDYAGSLNGTIYRSFETINMGGGDDVATVAHNVGNVNLQEGADVAYLNEGSSGQIAFGGGNDTANIVYEINAQGGNSLSLDGGSEFDTLNLNSFGLEDAASMAREGELGDFVSFASMSTDGVWESDLLNLTATNFEHVEWDKSSQDSNSVSDARLVGVSEVSIDVDDDLTVEYDVSGFSNANASAVSLGSSAYSELITIGVEDSDFDAEDGISFDLDFGGLSSASSTSTSQGSDAVAVGFGLGFDGLDGIAENDANFRGSELDIAISNVSGVMADADSIVGDVMSVASNDVIDATELMVVADASLQAAISAEVQNVATSATTAGSSEAVGWQDVSLLEHSNVTSGGLGLIDVEATAFNNVSSESVGLDGVGGIVSADANSITTGISETDFTFADTESGISADLSDSTSASATSVFGNAVANLTSSIKGIFGGGSPNTIENADSISSIVNEQGFAEASSIGGTAESTADQSVEAISSYDIATTEQLALTTQSNLASITTSAVTEA